MASSASGSSGGSSFDWAGLLNTGINLYSALNTSSKNQTAAQNYGNTTQYNPYNLTYGNASVGFSGNNAVGQLSPEYQALQKQLAGGASGYLNGLGTNQSNGGINPFLQGSFDQYNQQAGGVPTDPRWNTNQISTGMGDQFNATGQGFLGSLGSFDPNQAAQSYSNNLRQQAQPGNQRAAEGLAQQLFNSGRLGSTGGANMFGELINQQNQQDLGFQIAGQQYGGQEQNRLAGLAQGFGQLGTGINAQYSQLNDQFANSGFNRAMQGADATNARAQQRFGNAMNLFNAGQQNQQSGIQNALGLLQGSQGLDQNLLQAIGLGGNLGAQKSGVNQNAYQPGLEASVAKNNTNGAALGGIIGGLQDTGLLDKLTGWYNDNYGQIGDVNVTTPRAPPRPNAAGGEAANAGGALGGFLNGLPADTSGIGYVTPSVSKTPSASTPTTTAPKGIMDTSSSGLLSSAGNAANIYTGVKEGGVMGYGKAAGSAASLAGYDVPALSYLGAVDKATHGDAIGGLYDAAMTYAGGPVGAIMNAVAAYGNKGKDQREAVMGKWFDEYTKSTGLKLVGRPQLQVYQFPDGRLVQGGGEAYKDIGKALLAQDQEGYTKALDNWIKTNTKDPAKIAKIVPSKQFPYPVTPGG